jgi:hypothetical protein
MSLLRKMLVTAGTLAAMGCLGIAATVASVETSCVVNLPPPVISSDFGIRDEGYGEPRVTVS